MYRCGRRRWTATSRARRFRARRTLVPSRTAQGGNWYGPCTINATIAVRGSRQRNIGDPAGCMPSWGRRQRAPVARRVMGHPVPKPPSALQPRMTLRPRTPITMNPPAK
jgi:hypothetical protein